MPDTFYVAEVSTGVYISGYQGKPPLPLTSTDMDAAVWSWNEHDLQAWLDERNISAPPTPTQKIGTHPTQKPPVT